MRKFINKTTIGESFIFFFLYVALCYGSTLLASILPPLLINIIRGFFYFDQVYYSIVSDILMISFPIISTMLVSFRIGYKKFGSRKEPGEFIEILAPAAGGCVVWFVVQLLVWLLPGHYNIHAFPGLLSICYYLTGASGYKMLREDYFGYMIVTLILGIIVIFGLCVLFLWLGRKTFLRKKAAKRA